MRSFSFLKRLMVRNQKVGRCMRAFLANTRSLQFMPILDRERVEPPVEIELEPGASWNLSVNACDSLKAKALYGHVIIRAGEEVFDLTPGSEIELCGPRKCFIYESDREAASLQIVLRPGGALQFFLFPG